MIAACESGTYESWLNHRLDVILVMLFSKGMYLGQLSLDAGWLAVSMRTTGNPFIEYNL